MMSRILESAGIVALTWVWLSLPTAVAADAAKRQNVPPAGFTALFNGKDLDGWRGGRDDPKRLPHWEACWQAEDGMIKFVGPGVAWKDANWPHLVTQRTFKDFVLMVDWRRVGRAPTAVFFDCNGDGGGHVEIGSDQDLVTGAVGNTPRPKDLPPIDWSQPVAAKINANYHSHLAYLPSEIAALPAGQWNHMVVTRRGNHLSVELNRKLVIDNARLVRVLPETHIGFQNHGGDKKLIAEFRNVFIKELDK